jgi:hypothetical protein
VSLHQKTHVEETKVETHEDSAVTVTEADVTHEEEAPVKFFDEIDVITSEAAEGSWIYAAMGGIVCLGMIGIVLIVYNKMIANSEDDGLPCYKENGFFNRKGDRAERFFYLDDSTPYSRL